MKMIDNTQRVVIDMTYDEAERLWTFLAFALRHSDSFEEFVSKKMMKSANELCEKLDEYTNT